jgi:choline dehydrogenase-like flavoprotein
MQRTLRNVYDAIIIGSGATGGWAAKQLTEKGLKVIVLEAGRNVDPQKDYTMLKAPYEVKYRGLRGNSEVYGKRQPVQSKCYACNEYSHQWFVDDVDNPYTTPEGKGFDWIRGRQVGGRTLAWGRQSYRLSNMDLKAAEMDGYGEPWPISYDEIKPYYEQVENWIGVSGNYENLPHLPDSNFLPPMKMTCAELMLKKSVESKWATRRVTIGRAAILTKSINGRAACHFCGHCERGCETHSYFSSIGSTLPAAAATGRLTLRPHSVVSHLIVDTNTGKAKGVAVIDGVTKRPLEFFAKVIILCASTIESTRILLNSASRQHPNGFGNSSDALGRYLMDHTYSIGMTGVVPAAAKIPYNFDDGRANGIYIPRFRNTTEKTDKFLRGYGIQAAALKGMLPTRLKMVPGFGSSFKEIARNLDTDSPPPFWMFAFGEMLPRPENRVTINQNKKDAWGIPVAHIECTHGENEEKMIADQVEQLKEMAHEAGWQPYWINSKPSNPGLGIHEMGTARMGSDAKKSVLNKHNQLWDARNVFVTDGGAFASIGCVNPTLTMMALTVRACDYIVEGLKKGEI